MKNSLGLRTEIGFQRINSVMWPSVPYRTVALAVPQEVHARLRPKLVAIFGPGGCWSHEMLAAEARAFFAERSVVHVASGTKTSTPAPTAYVPPVMLSGSQVLLDAPRYAAHRRSTPPFNSGHAIDGARGGHGAARADDESRDRHPHPNAD